MNTKLFIGGKEVIGYTQQPIQIDHSPNIDIEFTVQGQQVKGKLVLDKENLDKLQQMCKEG